MGLTKFTGATNSVQTLPDRPSQEGFTPADIKIRFDQYSIDHKAWTNNVLTVEIDSSLLTANTNASNAVTTADSANTKADSAVATADTANTSASNAVNTANTASTNASNAVTTANIASSVATSANNTAVAVETDYNTIKPQLEQAVLDVDSKASVAYVDGIALNFTLGAIPNDTLTEAKMANEMKKSIVGGIASQDNLISLTDIVDDHTLDLADNAIQLALKANKAQESWITATLLNGWTGTLKYSKNDLGIVTVQGSIVAGTITAGTTVVSMPVGYRTVVSNANSIMDIAGTFGNRFFVTGASGNINVGGTTAFVAANTYLVHIMYNANPA